MVGREEASAPNAGRKRALSSEQRAQLALTPDGTLRPEPIPQGSEQQAQPTQEPLFPSEPTIRGQLTIREVQ